MNLTVEEIEQLKVRHKTERDGRTRDRIKAILLIHDGYTYEQVAKILLIDDDTVRRHIYEYIESQKVNNNNKGSESKLSKLQSDELIKHLQINTYLDVKPIINYVINKYNVKYSKSGITTWLKQHGFRYKKPHAVPAKNNQSQQQEFINKIIQVVNNKEELFYLDATHPAHQSKLTFGWIFKGSNKALPTVAKPKRIHLVGALALNTKHITILESDTINSQSIIAVIDKIKLHYNQTTKLHFVLDNAAYHKSSFIKEYLHNNKNIIFHYLPPYSPNLNLIERVWRFMHKKVTNNCYYEHFPEFRKSIMSFFNNIKKYKNELNTLLTFNFQKLNYNVGNFVK